MKLPPVAPSSVPSALPLNYLRSTQEIEARCLLDLVVGGQWDGFPNLVCRLLEIKIQRLRQDEDVPILGISSSSFNGSGQASSSGHPPSGFNLANQEENGAYSSAVSSININDKVLRLRKQIACVSRFSHANDCDSAPAFIRRCLRHNIAQPESFIYAAVLLSELVEKCRAFDINALNFDKLFVTAVVLACKFFDDFPSNNASYAACFQIHPAELGALELILLDLLDFQVFVSLELYYQNEFAFIPSCIISSLMKQ